MSSEYEIGKAIGELSARLQLLEDKSKPCGCHDSKDTRTAGQPGLTADEAIHQLLKQIEQLQTKLQIARTRMKDSGLEITEDGEPEGACCFYSFPFWYCTQTTRQGCQNAYRGNYKGDNVNCLSLIPYSANCP